MSRAISTGATIRGAQLSSDLVPIVNANLAALHSYPVADISAVRFSLQTYEDMLASSVVNITMAASNPNGREPGTPHDPKLGVVRNRGVCTACNMDAANCNGHAGIIEFNTWLAPPEKVLQTALKRLIGCICAGCSYLILEDSILEDVRANMEEERGHMSPFDWHEKLLESIFEYSLSITCHRKNIVAEHPGGVLMSLECKAEAFKVAAEAQGTVSRTASAASQYYPLEYYYKALERLSMDQLYYLGYADRIDGKYVLNVHPKSLITRAIPVMPLCSRAPMLNDTGATFHDLTKAYNKLATQASLVRASKAALLSHMDASGQAIKGPAYTKAKADVDNAIAGMYQAHNDMYEEDFKGILSSKNAGLVRNESQGKVVMHIGRSVVVPDPRNRVGQVSVPRRSAKLQSVRVTVTLANLGEITGLLKNGNIQRIYPHTAMVEGTFAQVTSSNKDHLSVQIGDEVARDLQDGDVVLFIRQPTIGGLSVIPGVIRLWDFDVYGFALEETEIRAMDFDGDEVNAVIPQSDTAAAELASIMAVEQIMINPKDQSLVFGVVQDGILGANIMTSNPLKEGDVISDEKGWVTIDMFHRITALVSETCQSEISVAGAKEGIVNKLDDFKRRLAIHGKVFSMEKDDGQEVVPTDVLISWAFPPNIFYSNPKVSVQDGILVRGMIDKSSIGRAQNTIIANIALTNRVRAIDFTSDISTIATSFLSFYGMSAGWSDCAPVRADAQYEIGKILTAMYVEIDKLAPPVDAIDTRRYESELESILSTASGKTDILINNGLDPNNRILKIINSGAKGTNKHLYSIVGILGQQYSASKLPKRLLTGGTRHTWYFDADDRAPTGMGMCTSSLSDGLSPVEAVFQAGSARMSFINLNVTTPGIGKTGNEIRRVTQGLSAGAQGGCVDGDQLISPLYGADGMSPERMIRLKQPSGELSLNFTNLQLLADTVNAEKGWYRQ